MSNWLVSQFEFKIVLKDQLISNNDNKKTNKKLRKERKKVFLINLKLLNDYKAIFVKYIFGLKILFNLILEKEFKLKYKTT